MISALTRRAFLKQSALGGAGLVIGFRIAPVLGETPAAADPAVLFSPNAFLRISPDDTITVIIKHLEMGQGVYTGLSQVAAEELDADWSKVRIETAPADATRYNNLHWGPSQGTGGSSSIANSWNQLREAGAQARAMLIAAAAARWNVPESQLITVNGELAEAAARREPPEHVSVKADAEFKIIGKSMPRLDLEDKCNGQAIFAIDVQLPDLLTAVMAHPPRFGGKVKKVDDEDARKIPGVRAVVTIPEGVAVVADNFWAAKKARDVLKIEWDDDAASRATTSKLFEEYKALATQAGNPARNDGDVEAALESAAQKIEATFTFPYLAHAPMEPLTCVVHLKNDALDVWAGAQAQTMDQANAAEAAGLQPDQVKIHTVLAGGSFGRHANPTSDYITQAVHIAKATRELDAPIRLVWTRDNDIRGGYYRPLYIHALSAGLDKDGKIVAWRHRIVGQSILTGTPFAKAMVKDGIDHTSVEGASTLLYEIPNLRVDLKTTDTGVPVLWWRSVGSTHTALSTEVFLDELAHKAGKDPLELRRELLKQHPRHLGALNLAAEKAGWGTPLPKGRGRGLAVHESFNSVVAEVAEVTVDAKGKLKVDRVVCAVDCGIAVNPDLIKSQMEGGIGFGLGALLHGQIDLDDGVVQQSNFHDYEVLRMNEMPKIEVHIVPSQERPTGVGEPGVPPISPAVVNAIFAATGKRVRDLPIRNQDLGAA